MKNQSKNQHSSPKIKIRMLFSKGRFANRKVLKDIAIVQRKVPRKRFMRNFVFCTFITIC
ncbi:MAG: hypothetical protein HYY67_00395 [Thaumarchaeota archaeon]|nr:hypothetical protein [Nitrososphaerota archaeon]